MEPLPERCRVQEAGRWQIRVQWASHKAQSQKIFERKMAELGGIGPIRLGGAGG